MPPEEKHGLERNIREEERLKTEIEALGAEEKRLRTRRDEIRSNISEAEWQELRTIEQKLERLSFLSGVQKRTLRDQELGLYEDKY